MTNFKIVLPGEAPVKKNARKQQWTHRDKNGNRVPNRKPASWYSKEYTDWAWIQVQRLVVAKQKNEIPYLDGQYVCTMLFFRSTLINLTGEKGKGKGQTIDLQNLYDSVLDIFAGNSGLHIPKRTNIGHEDYKILKDDSFAFIKNHGKSFIFQDFANPRTEVFITDFDEQLHWKQFKELHPNLEIGYIPEPEPSLFDDGEEFNLNDFMKGD